MKAFLSYDFTDNISVITSLLASQGVEIFDSRNDIQYGTSFQKAIKNAISECDFLLLIYSNRKSGSFFFSEIIEKIGLLLLTAMPASNAILEFSFE